VGIILFIFLGLNYGFSQTAISPLNCMYNDSVNLQMVNTSTTNQKSNQFSLVCLIPNQQISIIDTVKMSIYANDNCGANTSIKSISLDEHLPETINFLDITLGNDIDLTTGDVDSGIIRHDTSNQIFTVCESKIYIHFDVIQIDTLTNLPILNSNYIENVY